MSTSAPAAAPATSSSYLRMLHQQTVAANIHGQGEPAPVEATRSLRAVEADERPRRELTGSKPLPEAVGDALWLDGQARASARKLLKALEWTPQSLLDVWVDADRGLLWVQVAEVIDTHDTDGSH